MHGAVIECGPYLSGHPNVANDDLLHNLNRKSFAKCQSELSIVSDHTGYLTHLSTFVSGLSNFEAEIFGKSISQDLVFKLFELLPR